VVIRLPYYHHYKGATTMAACDPISEEQFEKMLRGCRGPYKLRDQCLMEFLGSTGYRISEALSVTIGQVWDGTKVKDDIHISADYGTFEEYLHQRWHMGQSRAYQLMDAAGVVTNLKVSTVVELPRNESQARPLASLPPEQQAEVWQEAVKTATAGKVTAKHVQATVKRVRERATPQTPKVSAAQTRRPARQEVQEGLIWGLREIADDDAWNILEWIWDMLNDKAEKYESLRGMLVRVQRRFPEEHRPGKMLADESGMSPTSEL
jgi:hypothetical protein